ncbi:class I SAM-dependent methyltransferase [Kiloniella sp. EL199]|uniref:class I SAM-dependent methyltransferase n=1 Tax=Kiloniella sp. EL199 TaxID=2107581 RepID=UPI000EA02CEE|nr:SAM-dependent methyltransferase [Kiloniella sp. EL199]
MNTTPKKGSLFESFRRRIKLEGAISVADYMADVLIAPTHGYYISNEPFGVSGDFITSPEISQMFGELIGFWCADTWNNMGGPTEIHLVEMGPGRGTLMSDLMRAAAMVPGLHSAVKIHLIEVSPKLRKKQKEALSEYDVSWYDDLTDLPQGPCIFIANEFFDALPIRQFERSPKGWCERLITLDEDETDLVFTLSSPSKAIETIIPLELVDSHEGAVVELSSIAANVSAQISHHINNYGGAALFVDYGWATPTAKPSLQAIRSHKKHPVLQEPGTADISAFVDFPTLKKSAQANGVTVYGTITQGDFLRSLGIEQRAEMLRRNADQKQVIDIAAAEHRLTDPSQMGNLFKVMALTKSDQPTPAAFPEQKEAS